MYPFTRCWFSFLKQDVGFCGEILLFLPRSEGISGWYPVHTPPLGWGDAVPQAQNDIDASRKDADTDPSPPNAAGLQRVVGGLELSIKFAHHEDLDRVLHAGRGVGWAPEFDTERRDWEDAGLCMVHTAHSGTQCDQKETHNCLPIRSVHTGRLDLIFRNASLLVQPVWTKGLTELKMACSQHFCGYLSAYNCFTDESSDRLSEVTVSVDSAVFPLSNALVTGQTRLDKNARCYIRYKFYDKSKFAVQCAEDLCHVTSLADPNFTRKNSSFALFRLCSNMSRKKMFYTIGITCYFVVTAA